MLKAFVNTGFTTTLRLLIKWDKISSSIKAADSKEIGYREWWYAGNKNKAAKQL